MDSVNPWQGVNLDQLSVNSINQHIFDKVYLRFIV